MKRIEDFFQVAGWGREMGKRGGLLDEESVKVIIAVAIFASMIYLMVSLFAPVFSEADAVAEAYFDVLETAIKDAPSSFFIIDNGKEDLDFYLVYFGEAVSFEKFLYKKNRGERGLCVCSEDDDNVVCRHCVDVGLRVRLDGQVLENWVVGEGKRLRVMKSGEVLDFVRVDGVAEEVESVEDDEVVS